MDLVNKFEELNLDAERVDHAATNAVDGISEHIGTAKDDLDDSDTFVDDYKYEPLPTLRHIRVLTLKAAANLEDPIECDIGALLLNEGDATYWGKELQDYYPLSYSWGMNEDGDASPSREIRIRGRCFKVTQNLFEGLRRIRSHQSGDLRMWIDAVCINQLDEMEQSSQVAMMADVYRNGKKTLIWLGEGDPGEDEAAYRLIRHLRPASGLYWDVLERLSGHSDEFLIPQMACYQALTHVGDRDDCTFNLNEPCSCGGPLARVTLQGNHEGVKAWQATLEAMVLDMVDSRYRQIEKFVARRYWKRRWVVQELYSSLYTECFWGSYQTSSDDLKVLPEVFRGAWEVKGLDSLHPGQTKPSLPLLDNFNSLFCRPTRTRIAGLLFNFRYFECSDPKDCLYSLLSLDGTMKLRPDYQLSISQVYTQFARSMIESGYWSWVFWNFSCQRPNDKVKLPSWVPNIQSPGIQSTMDDVFLAHWRQGCLNITFNADHSVTMQVWYLFSIRGSETTSNAGGRHTARLSVVHCPLIQGTSLNRRKRSPKGPKGRFLATVSLQGSGQMKPGDIVCALRKRIRYRRPRHKQEVYQRLDLLLVLRRDQQSSAEIYRIVGALNGSTLWNLRDRGGGPRISKLSDSDRMTVRII